MPPLAHQAGRPRATIRERTAFESSKQLLSGRVPVAVFGSWPWLVRSAIRRRIVVIGIRRGISSKPPLPGRVGARVSGLGRGQRAFAGASDRHPALGCTADARSAVFEGRESAVRWTTTSDYAVRVASLAPGQSTARARRQNDKSVGQIDRGLVGKCAHQIPAGWR